MEKFRQKNGNILCPTCSETFSPAKIASCVRPEVLEQFMEARKLLLQQLEQERAQRQMREELQKAKEQITKDVLREVKASEDARMRVEVMQHTKDIEETILNLACPRCHQVFVDFAGCAALTCSREGCGCGFCALCLEDCGGDAHAHVAKCEYRPRRMNNVYFTNANDFKGVQRARRERMLRSYFATKVKKTLHKSLYEELRKQLQDLGIEPDPAWVQPTPAHGVHSTQQQIEADELLARHLSREDGYNRFF